MIKEIDKKEFIKYLKTIGLEVNTKTGARGHQGFFTQNRIDISKNIEENRFIPTLLHEFAHFIHSKIDSDITRTGGSLEKIFKSTDPIYKKELIRVTQFVDTSSRLVKLYEFRDKIREKIKLNEQLIKAEFPEFQRSKPFKPFEKFIKHSEAKYLLKYDRVKLVEGFWKPKTRLISIENLEQDFPEMPQAYIACIRLKSLQRKQSRVSSRINRYKKYYERPTELFARLVEGLYIDEEWVCALAPETTTRFYELLDTGYYGDLAKILKKE